MRTKGKKTRKLKPTHEKMAVKKSSNHELKKNSEDLSHISLLPQIFSKYLKTLIGRIFNR